MKIRLTVLISMLGGLILGVGTTFVQFQFAHAYPDSKTILATVASDRPVLVSTDGAQPEVEIDQEVYNFGVMEVNQKASHDFIISNRGNHPLELRAGKPTCRCTVSDLANGTVAPQESIPVKISWEAGRKSGEFREEAPIFTNDPQRRRLHLTVSGRVVQSLEIVPSELSFGKLMAGEEKTAQLRFLCFRDELEVTEAKIANELSRPFFDVRVAPLSPDELEEAQVASGARVTVTIKPGLPLGPFNQQLDVLTNVTKDTVVPISGQIASEISIYGKSWDAHRGTLHLGAVKSSEGAERELKIFVRGKNPEAVEFGPIEVSPDVLRVRFGEKEQIGHVIKVPLWIEVPKGSRPINRLGTQQGDHGKIVIHTSHPQASQLRIFVRFAVE